MFFPCFSFSLVLFGCNKCKYDAAMIGPRVPSRIPLIQLDILGQKLAIWMYSFAKHGHATVLIEFLNNRLCHYGVFGWIHEITKILLTLREITKKITKNFQLPKKSEKSRNITKSNLNYQIWSHWRGCDFFSNPLRVVDKTLTWTSGPADWHFPPNFFD
jgi:hypothetical protein